MSRARLAAAAAAVAIGWGVYCSAAQAVLVERDWLAPGDGLLTYDTETRLEWLDLTESQGFGSYDDMSALLAAGGGAYAGFRYAVRPEIDGLLAAAGLAMHGLDNTVGDQAEIAAYHALLGITQQDLQHNSSAVQNNYAFGLFDEVAPANVYGPGRHYYTFVQQNFVFDYTKVTLSGWLDYRNSPSIGHHLVRAAVPEPPLALLLGAGLIGVVAARRSQRQRD